ncbi:MAG: SxtJ family membrane protein [Candidatus Binataceae bacterium]
MKPRAAVAELRNFGLLVGAIFAGLFGVARPWWRHARPPLWPWLLAAALLGCAIFAPRLLRYPHLAWERVGRVLGWVNSRIVLHLIFFLIFVPAGLLARVFKWDPLNKIFEPARQSYRIPSKRKPASTMEKPY